MAGEACRVADDLVDMDVDIDQVNGMHSVPDVDSDIPHKVYDIIVIGAGSGTKISTPAVKLGFKVALCERGFNVFGQHKSGLGGTCLNRGCIPSKCLIHVAEVAENITQCNHFELSLESPGFTVDWKRMVDRVSNMVDTTSGNIKKWYDGSFKDKLFVYPGSATFVGHKQILTEDDQGNKVIIEADKIFLVPGSKPLIPKVPGLAGTPYMTSTEALRLTEKPKSLTIIGAGYIALEMAFYFGGLGVDIHVLIRSRCLREVDAEIQAEFQRVFSSRFDCHCSLEINQVSYDSERKEFSVKYTGIEADKDKEKEKEKTTTISSTHLLVATGVSLNSDTLNLEATGVEMNNKNSAGEKTHPDLLDNAIIVDDHLRTTCDGIYAFGDVIGKHLFRHAANYEAEYLLTNVLRPMGRKSSPIDTPIDLSIMPWAVFTKPQVAGVGPTEQELIKDGISYVKGVCPYIKSAMGDALLADHGLVKLLVERGTRKILGAHIVGEQASVLLHQFVAIMQFNGTLDDLLNMIHVHPSLNELVRNSGRLARDALVELGDEIPDSLAVK